MSLLRPSLFSDLLTLPFQELHQSTPTDGLRVYSEGDGCLIEVDAPGVKTGDVDLTVRDRTLRVNWKRTLHGGTEEKFYRAVRLSAQLDESNIEASLRDGILTVKVPKRETIKSVEIKVKVT